MVREVAEMGIQRQRTAKQHTATLGHGGQRGGSREGSSVTDIFYTNDFLCQKWKLFKVSTQRSYLHFRHTSHSLEKV